MSLCERVRRDCCLTPNEQFFSYIRPRTSYTQWNDNDSRFVLDQHALLDLKSTSLLKQQWVDMSFHSDILMVFRTNQLFALAP